MATGASQIAQQRTATCDLGDLVQQHGTATARYPAGAAMRSGRNTARNLADASHALCELHGFHPDLLSLARDRAEAAPARDWFDVACDAFAEERAMLTRIVVSAGPIPSTPGQAETETATIAQRHALEMLGRSERAGTAIGAAAALLLDWRAVRVVLDHAAERFGLSPTRFALPAPGAVLEMVVALIGGRIGMERAAVFGAQQYLLQQRALWDLLEAREAARCDT